MYKPLMVSFMVLPAFLGTLLGSGGYGGDEQAEPSHGIWYTAGTTQGYARRRPDKSYPAEEYARVYPGKNTVYSGPMATYCAWHRPIAIYVPSKDKTFFVFGNPKNYPTISYYDHAHNSFAAPVVLDTNPNNDAHRNPTILIDQSGSIYVFYGAHGHPTRVVKSASPFDITKWVPAADIPERNTYPQPWQLKEGEIFVSYRASPGWCFRKSVDGVASWQPKVDLVQFAGATPYAVTIAEKGPYPRKVHIAFSKMGGGTPEEVRTKALWARRYNVYYAYSDDGGTTWKKRDGSVYTLPITEATAEQVHDSGEHGVWLKDIQLDSTGNPYILFIDADVTTYQCTWNVARYSGGNWQLSPLAKSDHMYDKGALVILSDNDFRIYAPTTASQDYEDGGEIEEWTSTDRGVTWTNSKHITSGSEYSHNHVKPVFNHQKGGFRILWSYGDSNYPPASKNVYLYRYGEELPGPERMRFPGPCVREPVVLRRVP